jgi:hypothetical protein
MKLRILATLIITGVLWITSCLISPHAAALTSIKLFDISYHQCPPGLADGTISSDGSGQIANCFIITGKAENKSGKMVVDADVFGRIYDANNNPALQNRTRVGTITEIPPGISDFEIRISVPENQPTPLKLEQFKASGFASQVRPFYYDN